LVLVSDEGMGIDSFELVHKVSRKDLIQILTTLLPGVNGNAIPFHGNAREVPFQK
jgi:hypothetical protein